jgi:mono/diheme cytochrome c family protein
MKGSTSKLVLRSLGIASVIVIACMAGFSTLDLSSAAEPLWIEKQVAGGLLAMNIRLHRTANLSSANASPEELEHSKEIYDQQCSFCHGSGEGRSGFLAKSFSPRPPQFAAEPLSNPTWMDAYVIRYGVRWTAMPAFPNLSEKDAWDLAVYVEHMNEAITSSKRVGSTAPALETSHGVKNAD